MNVIRSSTSALKLRLQAVATHVRANLPRDRPRRTEARPEFLTPFERQLVDIRQAIDDNNILINRPDKPFVKDFKNLDNYFNQLSSRMEVETSLSDKPMMFVHGRRSSGGMCLTAVDANLSPIYDIVIMNVVTVPMVYLVFTMMYGTRHVVSLRSSLFGSISSCNR